VADSYPSTAHILTLIGGILIIIDALVTVAFAGALGSVSVFGGALAAVLIGIAVVGLIIGFLILYGSTQIRIKPAGAKTWGILIIVLSIVSLFTASGFFIGFLLALIGGILAYTWKAPMASAPSWNANPSMTGWGASSGGAPPIASSPPPATAQKFCAHCGSANAPAATFCAHCGAALT
jgi:hypothetical protein